MAIDFDLGPCVLAQPITVEQGACWAFFHNHSLPLLCTRVLMMMAQAWMKS